MGDLCCRETGKRPQCEYHLGRRGKSGVAAGEDEPEPVIADIAGGWSDRLWGRTEHA